MNNYYRICNINQSLKGGLTLGMYLVFNNETAFHMNGHVNKENVRFSDSNNPHNSKLLYIILKAINYAVLLPSKHNFWLIEELEDWLWPQLPLPSKMAQYRNESRM
jgi:hypothetical protein